MKSLILFVLLLICSLNTLKAQCEFPEKCLGIWKGNMKIYTECKLVDSVDVMLTVTNTESSNVFGWKTEYLSEKYPVVKDYKMRCPAEGNNLYTIDEGDGIELNEYLFDNKLYSIFETSGFLLTSTYELIDDKIIFEVTSGAKLKSCGEVINYSVRNLQRVVFRRIKG